MPDVRETGKIYCIEDAHTRSNTIWNVHDEDVNIMSVAVGRHSQGYQCYGFFKFAPHGVPDNAIIVSATFGGRVYQRLLAGNFDLTARPCSGPWTDTEITYKTMPTSAGVSDVIGMADAGDPVESDITAIVQAWFRGDFDYANGLYITSSAASSYKRVYSCTATDANKPYINIVYYVPASKPTTDKTSIEITAGTTVNITTNRLSDEYTHTLTWALGSATGAIAENVTNAYAWTLTDADVSALLAALPAAESGTLKIVCETLDAAGKPLGTESTALTATVPADVLPKITAINITGLDLGKGNVYLSGISRMQVDVTAVPGEGSTIRSVVITAGGRKYTGTSITTDPLSGDDKVGASVSVTDARGRTIGGGYNSNLPVYRYAAPAVNAFAIERCSEDGSAVQIDGEYLRFALDASASLISMPSANQVTAEIYTKLRSASEWTLAGSYNNQTNVLKLENAVLPGTYSPLSSYDILLRLTDSMGTSADRLTVITTATSLQHYDPYYTRVTFGRIGESTDPEHALITALDLIAEAGVSLHGADVADGQIDLPDGGMIAAKAAFEAVQSGSGDADPDNIRPIRTLESVNVTAALPDSTDTFGCSFSQRVAGAEIDFAAGRWTETWKYLELTGEENCAGSVGASGNWVARMRPESTAAYIPGNESGSIVCNVAPPVTEAQIYAGNGVAIEYGAAVAIRITDQPEGKIAAAGDTAIFTVTAIGESLSYQWQWQDASGGDWWGDSGLATANTASLEVPVTADRNRQIYRCVITDAQGRTVASDAVGLTVGGPDSLAIITHPGNQIAASGDTAIFAVIASGEGLTYQWQWQSASGGSWGNSGLATAKTASLEVPVTADRNGQRYRCLVTDASGSQAVTRSAMLSIGENEDKAVHVLLSITGIASESAFAAYLAAQYAAGTPVTVAYKLATPIEHAIAPQLIAAPAGLCTITTNADTLTAHAAGGRIFYTIAQAINALGRT